MKLKKLNFWVRRKSHLAVIIIGGLVVALLFFNDDASVKLNTEYQLEINQLKSAIRQADDSARYYREKREALLTGTEDLEQIAREEYHMHRPSEDVYIVK